MTDIVVFGAGQSWHLHVLTEAFRARGHDPVVTSLKACSFCTASESGLSIPGLHGKAPRAAFVLTVPGSGFEEVTLYLGLLHALAAQGATVWNGPRAIERCVDKSTTTHLLSRAGIATPWTWAGSDHDAARAHVAEAERAGRMLVQKPLFGSEGRGLRQIRTPDDLAPAGDVNNVYYLQDYVAPADGSPRDWRVFVCQDTVIAAMIRHGTSWITNMGQGARAEAAEPPAELCDVAVRALAAVGAAYGGVDIVADQSGRFLVLEINSMPAWSALERVTAAGVAEHLVAAFLENAGLA